MASAEGNEDLHKLKVIELKKILKEKGLPVGGTKDELIERLTQANSDAAAEKLLEETSDAGAEAEGESIDEELEDEIMNEDATKLGSSNVENTAVKRKAPENGEMDKESQEPPSKKVEESAAEGAETNQADKENSTEVETAEAQVVKLSSITPEEKLDMRAKKFGLSEVAKKELRAKRFGISAPTATAPTTTAAPKVGEKATSVLGNEALKKRAERFGINTKSQGLGVSETKTAGSKTEDAEKKKQRAERFGIKAAPVIDTSRKISIDKANPILAQSQKERKLLRANRFRT